MKNKNNYIKNMKPSRVDIVCESNGKTISADVISISEKVLVAAISGMKITLISSKQNGIYQGRMSGLDYLYTKNN